MSAPAIATLVGFLRLPRVRRRIVVGAALAGCFVWMMVVVGLAFALIERGVDQWWAILVFGLAVLVVAVAVAGGFRRAPAAAALPTPATRPAPVPVVVAPSGLTRVPVEPLSPREREVLAQLAAGRSNREIAAALFVAPGTVKAHLNHIFQKLDASTRLQAVAHAREAGLLVGDD
ncbi:regulatory protein, luxR family [Asanoa hainanensis]|uniref:Regulatory protein, luxR family n=1 Tax=Asanoa hainanensis TaxID=560556 RepID=A0A239P7M1_9ACTN|nr:helix-turn-helix transcriptional regulator [Asanoa hainanensis]SNT62704.1 regulatory protein, luxR family [Asanoa hainanensis]